MALSVNKPAFETINPDFGRSFTYKKFSEVPQKGLATWHYHPEIEMVYVNGGSGKRQIGSHISYFNDGDLILIGSNLPHCGFTDKLTGNKRETIIQMKPDFLGDRFFDLPEMANIKTLLNISNNGIAFFGGTKDLVGSKMEEMETQSNFERLLSILEILNELGNSKEMKILNAEGFTVQSEIKNNDRINVVFNHVKNNFNEEIRLEDIADLVNMTIPSFCRFFKKITGKTFTQFVNEYRLVHAAKLLTEGSMSITQICYECGFNNFSHFNKSFKSFTGQNPSTYRNQLRTVLQ